MSDRESWVPDDPWYERQGGHIVSGDGVYCPEDGEMYEPEKGDGNTCQLCGHVRGDADE